jgi:nuclear pore complex protein Nup98-Nup96
LSGAFGATNNNANTSAFGVKPATGFGAFGGTTGAFGVGTTTGTFGQPNNQASTSTSVFGQPANTTTNAFGSFNKTFGGERLRTFYHVELRLSTLSRYISNNTPSRDHWDV